METNKRNLASTGLSMTQASSISNLLNQRCQDIEREFANVNNSEHKFKIGTEEYTSQTGKPLPPNCKELILEKGQLHGAQAYLMEHIKLKDALLKEIKARVFVCEVEAPTPPEYKTVEVKTLVDEKWGWAQLTDSEYADYLEAEAMAAHIGQFIHKGSVLDKLRTELPQVKELTWMEIEKDKKTPVLVKTHHTSAQLLTLHEELAAEHRKYEQKVNYFKAKVKNLVSAENASIEKENAENTATVNKENSILREAYTQANKAYQEDYQKAKFEFESKKHKDTQEVAALRIHICPQFKKVVDTYMEKITIE